MAIEIKCSLCGVQLMGKGALIFGIPDTNNHVYKHHVCSVCYNLKIMPLLQKEKRDE